LICNMSQFEILKKFRVPQNLRKFSKIEIFKKPLWLVLNFNFLHLHSKLFTVVLFTFLAKRCALLHGTVIVFLSEVGVPHRIWIAFLLKFCSVCLSEEGEAGSRPTNNTHSSNSMHKQQLDVGTVPTKNHIMVPLKNSAFPRERRVDGCAR
jgi:hypothetical protein